MKLKFQLKILGALVAAAAFNTGTSRAADAPVAVPFKELYSVIESNLAGILPAELDQAAVKGLLRELEGRATLLTATNAASTNIAGVLRTNVYDGAYGYVRLGALDDKTAPAFAAALKAVRATNELKGLVIDLRYSGGADYQAAMTVADLFIRKEMPLLHLEETVLKSTAKADVISLPTVILVNRRTAGAGEALTAVLRQQSAALVIGGKTAGQAMIYRDVTLSNGQQLRLASRYIRVADGMLLPSKGLKPDIEVDVKESDERKYYEDAYATVGAAPETAGVDVRNAARSFNEAELVRRHREGQNPDAEPSTEKPLAPRSTERQVRDPSLSRALDLLKGLAVVKKLE